MSTKKLPPGVRKHIKRQLTSHKWAAIADAIDDPCKGCPAEGETNQKPLIDTPCAQCPFWALRADLFAVLLLRRLEDGGE